MAFRQFFRPALAADVDEELASHLEMRERDLVAEGIPAEQAREIARKRFGNVAVIGRACREIDEGIYRREKRTSMWRDLRQDLAYGVRVLGRARGFTVVAVITLALGIGGSAAIFSVIEAALLRPLPYPNPEQLVEIMVESKSRSGRMARLAPSVDDVRAWREHRDLFSHVTIWRTIFDPIVVDGPELERLRGRQVSEDYLALHGVSALFGRGFIEEDMREGAEPVIMLGYAYWQDRFGRDPNVIGRTLRIDNVPAMIVGVLPPSFSRDVPIWRPHKVPPRTPQSVRGSGATVYARLQPGVTLANAQRILAERTRASDLATGIHPADGIAVESLYERATFGYRNTTDILAAAVGAILLIACINVAGLLLARGATRRAELGIRASLGAGRLRLVRQLLAESLVLALAGGVAGALLAWVSLDLLVANIPLSLPENSPPALNVRVLGFTLMLALATGLAFGLAPALSLSRVDLSGTLARANQRFGSSLSRRGGQLLIAAEVALCLVLLAGAGLMIRSFTRMMSVDVGFDPDSILTMEVIPVDASAPVLTQYYPALVESLRTLPGVAAAGAINNMPLQGGSTLTAARADGADWMSLHTREFIPGYFEAIGLRLVDGRLPSPAEMTAAMPAVIINAEAARQMFGEQSAVGRRFERNRKGFFHVVGVIGDVRHSGPTRPPDPELYLPFGRDDADAMVVVIRPSGTTGNLHWQLRRAAESVGPRVVVQRIRTGSDWLDDRVLTPRRRTVLLTLLGALGLVLSMVGVFGMTAYTVARRTQEVGVRMALGARAGQVVRDIVRESLWPALWGIAAGIGGAAFATQVIASFLFETRPIEPVTFAMVAVLVALAAAVAAWLPARRAARVDPVSALRVTT